MSRRIARSEIYLLLAMIVLGALTSILLLAKPFSRQDVSPPSSLNLRVADQNGRMRIDWDGRDPAVQSAQGGTLEVEDGGVLNRYPVEPNVLRSGGLDYVRRSEDVFLTLTLYHDGRPDVQSSVRRIAPVGPQQQLAGSESSGQAAPAGRPSTPRDTRSRAR